MPPQPPLLITNHTCCVSHTIHLVRHRQTHHSAHCIRYYTANSVILRWHFRRTPAPAPAHALICCWRNNLREPFCSFRNFCRRTNNVCDHMRCDSNEAKMPTEKTASELNTFVRNVCNNSSPMWEKCVTFCATAKMPSRTQVETGFFHSSAGCFGFRSIPTNRILVSHSSMRGPIRICRVNDRRRWRQHGRKHKQSSTQKETGENREKNNRLLCQQNENVHAYDEWNKNSIYEK